MSDSLDLVLAPGIFPPDSGGPATFAVTLGTRLLARGHEVTVITTGTAPEGFDADYPFEVVRLPRDDFLPVKYIRQLGRLVRELRVREPDVVLTNAFELQGVTAARLAGVPVVSKIVGDRAWERARYRHGITDHIETFQTRNYGLRISAYKLLRTLPVRHATHIVTPSEYLREIVCSWGVDEANTSVIYNSIDPETAPRTLEEREPRIVTVGRLTDWKGIDGVIEAFETVAAERPAAELSIIGDGPKRSELETIAEETTAADRITFHGRVPHTDVLDIMSKSSVFVLNSDYEGLPHVVLEAMACRTPAVVSNEGGNTEVVRDGETGFIVHQGDVNAIADRIHRFLANENLVEQFGAAGRALLEQKFSLGQMTDEYESLLSEYAE